DLIEGAVLRTLEALKRDFPEFEILLINDGSTDGSGEKMEALAARYPEVRVLHNPKNLNVGATIHVGFRAATKTFLVHNAIDLPLAPENMGTLVEKMKNLDVLILERDSYPGYTPWRLVCSKLNRFLLKVLFDVKVQDLNFTQLYRTACIA